MIDEIIDRDIDQIKKIADLEQTVRDLQITIKSYKTGTEVQELNENEQRLFDLMSDKEWRQRTDIGEKLNMTVAQVTRIMTGMKNKFYDIDKRTVGNSNLCEFKLGEPDEYRSNKKKGMNSSNRRMVVQLNQIRLVSKENGWRKAEILSINALETAGIIIDNGDN